MWDVVAYANGIILMKELVVNCEKILLGLFSSYPVQFLQPMIQHLPAMGRQPHLGTIFSLDCLAISSDPTRNQQILFQSRGLFETSLGILLKSDRDCGDFCNYFYPLKRYPTPRTVKTNCGFDGSTSSFSRSQRTWTSTVRVSPSYS